MMSTLPEAEELGLFVLNLLLNELLLCGREIHLVHLLQELIPSCMVIMKEVTFLLLLLLVFELGILPLDVGLGTLSLLLSHLSRLIDHSCAALPASRLSTRSYHQSHLLPTWLRLLLLLLPRLTTIFRNLSPT